MRSIPSCESTASVVEGAELDGYLLMSDGEQRACRCNGEHV